MRTINFQIEKQANDLRKSEHYAEAIKLYLDAWNSNPTAYCSAGLLHCYRKLGNISDGLTIIEFINTNQHFLSLEWAKNEYLLFLIPTKLTKAEINNDFSKSVALANDMLKLTDDPIKINRICLPITSGAKNLEKWDLVSEWLKKIKIESLTADKYGEFDWTQQSIYYNTYFEHCLATNDIDTILNSIDHFIGLFTAPSIVLHFKRHKAHAYYMLEEYNQALEAYNQIRLRTFPSYILHEIALVHYKLDDNKTCLEYLIKAALSKGPHELKLNIYFLLAQVLMELGMDQEAFEHYKLYIAIKNDKLYIITTEVQIAFNQLKKSLNRSDTVFNKRQSLQECEKIWLSFSPKPEQTTGLVGKIVFKPDQPYGFITTTEGTSYYFNKKNVNSTVTNYSLVQFDTIPKFDSKKNVDSKEAINIILKGV